MDMVTPSINTLLKSVNSRYTLVVLAAKRTRQMIDCSEARVDDAHKSTKNVTNALEEIAEGKITYRRADGTQD